MQKKMLAASRPKFGLEVYTYVSVLICNDLLRAFFPNGIAKEGKYAKKMLVTS